MTIQDSGHISIDEFSYAERASPRVRTVLARFVSPTGIGFFSDATQGWPTVLYPIIYPWLTGLSGVAMMLLPLFTTGPRGSPPEAPELG